MQYLKGYIKYKNWYSKANYIFKQKYKKDYILFIGLIASTSPRFQVKRNINTSNIIYNDYIINKKEFIIYALKNKKEFIKKYKLLPAHYNNIIRVLKHNIRRIKAPLIISGLKVNSFYNNLLLNNNYITIDIHMMRFFKHKKDSLNIGQYRYYKKAFIKLVKHTNKNRLKDNKKPFKNYELQAIIWSRQVKRQGFKPKAFYDFI